MNVRVPRCVAGRAFVATAVAVLACWLPLEASDPTEELLSARHVDQDMFLRFDKEGLSYASEPGGRSTRLRPGQTVVVDDQVRLLYEKFNPFVVSLEAKATIADDPNYLQVLQFAEALKKLGQLIDPTATAAAGLASLSRGSPNDLIGESERSRANLVGRIEATPDCKYEKEVDALRMEINAAYLDIAACDYVTELDLNTWKSRGGSQADLVDTTKLIDSKIDGITTDHKRGVAEVQRLIAARDKVFDMIADPQQAYATCLTPLTALQGTVVALLLDSIRVQDNKKATIEALKKLAALTLACSDPARWTAMNGHEYFVVSESFVSPEKQITYSVAEKPITIAAGTDHVVTVTVGDGHAQEFIVRQYTGLVYEAGVGVVYADVERPKYGTGDSGGGTVVASAGNESGTIGVATVLNLVFRTGGSSAIHPLVQFGVALSTDSPAIVAGVGVRFKNPKMAIGIGAALPWVKDLNKLSVGDAVSGTADIEADLKYQTASVRPYFALMYNF